MSESKVRKLCFETTTCPHTAPLTAKGSLTIWLDKDLVIREPLKNPAYEL